MISLTFRSLSPSQNNHVHRQPDTGPAAPHLNSHQKTDHEAQENDEGSKEVSSSQMKD